MITANILGVQKISTFHYIVGGLPGPMGGPNPQGPMPGPGGPMTGPARPRGPGPDLGPQFGMGAPMGQSPGQDFGRDQPQDPRMMGDRAPGMPFGGPGPRPGMPPASMAGPGMGNMPANSMPGSVAGGMPNIARGGTQAAPAMVGYAVEEKCVVSLENLS